MSKKIKTNFEEIHNIKSIFRMNGYLKRLFNSYCSIYTTFVSTQDDLLSLQNELNLRLVDEQLIESYNKMVTFVSDQIENILYQTISGPQFSETFIIHPVDADKNQYVHKLEIIYFLPNGLSITKPLGNVSNVSIVKINDHVKILRSTQLYDFVYIESSAIMSIEDFRDHLDKCMKNIKELMSWFYNDIDFTKMAFRALLNVMSDAIKMSHCKYEQKKWIKLLCEIKTNIDDVYESMATIENGI